MSLSDSNEKLGRQAASIAAHRAASAPMGFFMCRILEFCTIAPRAEKAHAGQTRRGRAGDTLLLCHTLVICRPITLTGQRAKIGPTTDTTDSIVPMELLAPFQRVPMSSEV